MHAVPGQDLQIHSGPMAGQVVPVTGGTGGTNLTRAFGVGPGLVVIGAVYLGVGMQAGSAVSAVLLYRRASCWLPGQLCWRSLQHRRYV
jgi:hypothetical protein